MTQTPSPFVLQRIYAEARRAVLRRRGGNGPPKTQDTLDNINKVQSFLRAVSVEFHSRLQAAGIHVES